MQWQRGFRRLRILGAVSLVLGIVLPGSLLLSQQAGYTPDPAFTQLYFAFWTVSLALVPLGLVLAALPWVLAGFVPEGSR